MMPYLKNVEYNANTPPGISIWQGACYELCSNFLCGWISRFVLLLWQDTILSFLI